MQKTVIEDLKKIFDEKKDALIQLNKNDAGSNFDYDPVKVAAIIDAFNFYSKENLAKKDYLFFTNGNPYSTIVIYLYSMINEVNITIEISQQATSLNHEIENILNDFMKKNWYKNTNVIVDYMNVKDLNQFIQDKELNYVYVFDHKEKYAELDKMGIKTIMQPLFTMDLYTESDDYKFLENLLENYCEMNLINMNVHEGKSAQFIYKNALAKGASNAILILTDKFGEAEKVKNNLKDKKVYINYNPFDNFEIDMVNCFLS